MARIMTRRQLRAMWARRNSGRRPYRTVKSVGDGDTFITKKRIQGTNRIRIAGIDSPERWQRGYASSKQRAIGLLQGKRVTLQPVARDIYGRLVSKVFIKGSNVAKRLKKK